VTLDSERIKARARELGFDLCGVASIGPLPESDFLSEWLGRGYAGKMSYLARREAERGDPSMLVPGARSIVVCAVNYNTPRPHTRSDRARAWISRYAWGDDYHEVIGERLRMLAGWIESEAGEVARSWVDTGPILERAWAERAGIGWTGKNTCTINPQVGSWIFLGSVLTTLPLAPDTGAPDRCGTCTRCLDACPTDAFVEPRVLDSRKCISYLNIELRGAIPEPLRKGIGSHLYGCDICQDVCPWNRRAPQDADPRFHARPGLFEPELESLLDLDDDGWRRLIRGTALKRARVRGLVRNLMVVAGNSGLGRLAGRVGRYLDYPDPDVRSHALWALGKLEGGKHADDERL
jgi:epoxyqueuosine reductase